VNVAEFTESALGRGRIAVCVGCGGVGKTTVAAAIALEAARRHRKVAVLTIDPARRLADALGVRELGNQPQEIPREALTALGVPEDGSLWAMMLDMKHTFDDLVERFAEDPEACNRILENPIYRHVSDALAGSVEYSAMEKVYELCERQEFDLIIVDTPPAQHALDFLDAPQRVVEFLDSRIVHILIHPAMAAGRFGFRIFHRSAHRVLQLLERVTGIGFLEDISEFLMAFEHMSEGFRERAVRVRRLLLGPEASFILIAGPARESVLQAEQFLDRLEATGVPLAGILVNRVHRWPGGAVPKQFTADDELNAAVLSALVSAFERSEGPDFPARVAARAAVTAAKGYAELVRRDEHVTAALKQRTERRGRYWGTIPELANDVHDLSGLAHIADLIFEPNGEESADGHQGQREEPDRPERT
jgi:anion-transporting  ArsA/GET3 family ATPase